MALGADPGILLLVIVLYLVALSHSISACYDYTQSGIILSQNVFSTKVPFLTDPVFVINRGDDS
jgi:hypothetical protein